MKKLLLVSLFALPLFASDLLLIPLGTWPICSITPQVAPFLCSTYVPGGERYLLHIAGRGIATAYYYTVNAAMKDGTARRVTGYAARVDNASGYTSIVIDLGGIARDWTIAVEDLAIVGERRQ